MIPKKIHYCWFGENEKPDFAKKCIQSWRRYCPDYEIIEWNETNFDLDINGYVKMCYDEKKFAFLSDYVRLVVIAQYGGVYFDTDVELIRSIDDLLINDAFYGFEVNSILIQGLVLELLLIILQYVKCLKNTIPCWRGIKALLGVQY